MRELLLTGDPSLLEITEERRGARLEIHVIGDRKAVGLARGVGALRGLELSSTGIVDAGALVAAYPDLQELSLRDATRVDDVARLGDLRRLRRLSLYGCYRLDVAALPSATAWPELERVRISGHRLLDAATLQERFAGAARFELSDGKTVEWLAANFDNPFRDWIDYDTRAGRAAAAAWSEAHAALSPAEEPPTASEDPDAGLAPGPSAPSEAPGKAAPERRRGPAHLRRSVQRDRSLARHRYGRARSGRRCLRRPGEDRRRGRRGRGAVAGRLARVLSGDTKPTKER